MRAQKDGPQEPWQGGLPAHCVPAPHRHAETQACHHQPQGELDQPTASWPSVGLQLRRLGLKFQLLWGHPALSRPSPKSQPQLRRTQVSSALMDGQEQPWPVCSPPPSLGPRSRARREAHPKERPPNWPERTQAPPSARPRTQVPPSSTWEQGCGGRQTHPDPRGAGVNQVKIGRALLHPSTHPPTGTHREGL